MSLNAFNENLPEPDRDLHCFVERQGLSGKEISEVFESYGKCYTPPSEEEVNEQVAAFATWNDISIGLFPPLAT